MASRDVQLNIKVVPDGAMDEWGRKVALMTRKIDADDLEFSIEQMSVRYAASYYEWVTTGDTRHERAMRRRWRALRRLTGALADLACKPF